MSLSAYWPRGWGRSAGTTFDLLLTCYWLAIDLRLTYKCLAFDVLSSYYRCTIIRSTCFELRLFDLLLTTTFVITRYWLNSCAVHWRHLKAEQVHPGSGPDYPKPEPHFQRLLFHPVLLRSSSFCKLPSTERRPRTSAEDWGCVDPRAPGTPSTMATFHLCTITDVCICLIGCNWVLRISQLREHRQSQTQL